MIEVELKQYLETHIEQYKNALLKHELYGIEEFDNLLVQLINLNNSLEISKKTFITLDEHVIDKYCLGEVVLKFVNNNFSYSSISEIISIQAGVIINVKQIKDWVENYSHLASLEKPQGHGNLFDIQERMQDIFSELQEHLHLVKQTDKEEFYKARITKQQVLLETYREIRALTKDAASIINSLSHQAQLQEFRKVIIESIKEVSPAVAQSVIRKLKQNKALYSALLPSD